VSQTEIIHNVRDRVNQWIGPWKIESDPVRVETLATTDEGRLVIWADRHQREVGVVSSWNEDYVFVRFTTGCTAEACAPEKLRFALENISHLFYHPPLDLE
jgi:hypothetical protein